MKIDSIEAAERFEDFSDKPCDCICKTYERHFRNICRHQICNCIAKGCGKKATQFRLANFTKSNDFPFSELIIPVCDEHSNVLEDFENGLFCVSKGDCKTTPILEIE